MSAEQSGFGCLDGDQPACIPPGDYQLRFSHHETKLIFQRPKLFLWFTVLDYGEHFGVKIARYYGLRRLIGKQGKGGRFAVGWKSDYLREYARLFGKPHRFDRIPMEPFKRVVIVGRVRTVTKGHDQREIAPDLHYSVVDELLRISDGEASAIASPAAIPLPPAPPT